MTFIKSVKSVGFSFVHGILLFKKRPGLGSYGSIHWFKIFFRRVAASSNDTINLVLEWRPDILLAGGPPLYLEQLSSELRNRAWQNAVRLASSVDVPILDHHLMRSREGLQWLDRLSSESGRRVLCAADFMRAPRRLLEADRKTLYDEIPVPLGWHHDYAEGKATTRGFQSFGSKQMTTTDWHIEIVLLHMLIRWGGPQFKKFKFLGLY